jgi:hypothetical protein
VSKNEPDREIWSMFSNMLNLWWIPKMNTSIPLIRKTWWWWSLDVDFTTPPWEMSRPSWKVDLRRSPWRLSFARDPFGECLSQPWEPRVEFLESVPTIREKKSSTWKNGWWFQTCFSFP